MKKYLFPILILVIFLASCSTVNSPATSFPTLLPTIPSPTPTLAPPTPTPSLPTPTILVSPTIQPTQAQLPALQVISPRNASEVQLLRTLQIPGYHLSSVSQCSLSFSPDGSLLSGVCGLSTAPVWDVTSGDLQFAMLNEASHEVAVAFNSTGDLLAVGGFSGEIQLFDPLTGEAHGILSTLPSQVWELDFNPSGDQLAIATFKTGVFLQNFPGGDISWSYSDNQQLHVLSVDISPDGRKLVYGTAPSGAFVVEVDTGERLASLDIPAPVGDLAYSRDGLWLATGSDDNKVRLWKTQDYSLSQIMLGHKSYVNGVVFTPDGSLIVTGSKDASVGLWNTSNGELIKLIEGHDRAVLRVEVNPQGTLIASISWDGTVRLWGVVGE